MKKNLRLITCVLLVLAAGLGVWWALQPREPVFEGRALSSWLDHHVPSSAANPPYGSPGWKQAEEALSAIGTNAIPTLLGMIRAKDPPAIVLKLMETLRRRGWVRIDYRYAMSRHEEAEYAFRVLGTNAAGAVPELIRIYEANISPSSQRCAALALANIGKPARAALPVLIRDFHHTNTQVRFYAVSAVESIGGEPDTVIPALTGVLKDTSVDVRWNALVGLSHFGSRARPVVPEILSMLGDPAMVGTSPIRGQVEITLWRIAPEQVGHPFVVEEATPLIEGGMTTAPVKVRYDGERRTLIKAGRSVPAIAQYWNSDPRAGLTLYRGDKSGEDHFLGRFEVLDLPATGDLNVSTLCVVAGGKIFLCARDNTAEKFVRIRRVESADLD